MGGRERAPSIGVGASHASQRALAGLARANSERKRLSRRLSSASPAKVGAAARRLSRQGTRALAAQVGVSDEQLEQFEQQFCRRLGESLLVHATICQLYWATLGHQDGSKGPPPRTEPQAVQVFCTGSAFGLAALAVGWYYLAADETIAAQFVAGAPPIVPHVVVMAAGGALASAIGATAVRRCFAAAKRPRALLPAHLQKAGYGEHWS